MQWLETRSTSPLNPSTRISEQVLLPSRNVSDAIEELVSSGALDDETMEAWQQRRDEPQRLFDAGCFLEAAKLGHPTAIGEMAQRYYYGTSGGVKVDHVKVLISLRRLRSETARACSFSGCAPQKVVV